MAGAAADGACAKVLAMADKALRLDEPSVLTATRMIDWRRAGGLALPKVGEAVVFTHESSLLGLRMPWRGRHSASALSLDVAPIAGTKSVSLVRCRGVGGPAAAIAIEELAAAGVRRLVAVDICGSIDPAVPGGRAVLIDRAIAADGTSKHYSAAPVVPPAAKLTEALREQLTRAGIGFAAGRAWTTDAAYRETRSLIETHRANGALVVDMEAAAVLAVSAGLGIEAAIVLVATDELFGEWRPPVDMALVRAQLKRLVIAAAAALQA